MRSRRGRLGDSRNEGPLSPSSRPIKPSNVLRRWQGAFARKIYSGTVRRLCRRHQIGPWEEESVKICPRTGQPCQGRGTADDPRSRLAGSCIPGFPCMCVSRSTLDTHDPAYNIASLYISPQVHLSWGWPCGEYLEDD